ncbi:class I SAM-dependent methyltransferase [Streptomonospora alba]|uniref:class I SAM-dependent methyltransferase n=1 Tax=Streptomonospora alba TaxID=183763 RepID=UPI000A07528D|nr:class I SAM-dependent methyltransferase [Streptomonospora alba]
MKAVKPWSAEEPTRSPFAVPRGIPGRLAGRLMLRTNRQWDLLDLLDVREGEKVLEVGYGPGGLIRLLRRTPAERIRGVDPSPEMRRLAARPHRAETAAGRIDLRLGTAERTGFDDEEFDAVVSVNNVAIWPDLEAGLRELHRVTRPGGRVLIAWHGGTRPSRIARGLALPEDKLARIEHGLRDLFPTVTRRELPAFTVYSALR